MALRLESLTPFWRLIVDHLECPDIGREYTHYDRAISPGDRPTGPHRRPSGPASPLTRQRTCAPSRCGRHAAHGEPPEEPRAMTLKSHDLAHIRSVVLAAHAGSGKTTLAEQLLFRAGAIPRLGRVDDGAAHLDFEPEEQKRRESLSLAVGTFESDGTRISLVDTPGYPDFIADVIEGFAAADGAIFVMDASAGAGGARPGHAGGVRRGTGGRARFFF